MNNINIRCPRCGIVHNCNFCPNCGLQAPPTPPPINNGYADQFYTNAPQQKKGMHGCLIAAIISFGVILMIGLSIFISTPFVGTVTTDSDVPKGEKPTKKTEFQTVTGCSAEQEVEILSILENCGIKSIDSIEHDEILDDLNEVGETGYRISSNDINNIILYLKVDKTVNTVRYAGNKLYENGEVKSTISDYTLTWGEQSDLQIRCKKTIESLLKSPSTAKFPNILKWTFWKEDGKIYVQSYVDAQNAFGATLRSEFQFIINADDHTVESLIFDGEEVISR